MPRDYKFHRPTCPKCGTPSNVTIGDPSFVIDMCPHCGLIYVARAADGNIHSHPANEYQIIEYRTQHCIEAPTSNKEVNSANK